MLILRYLGLIIFTRNVHILTRINSLYFGIIIITDFLDILFHQNINNFILWVYSKREIKNYFFASYFKKKSLKELRN